VSSVLSTIDRIREIAEPLLHDRGLELYDVEQAGPIVRVLVEGPDGVDLEVLGQVTRALSLALDEHDPIPGRYTLEVSSPGLERPLRTPRHFERAVGTEVTVKTKVDVDGERRFAGTLTDADAEGVALRSPDGATTHRLRYADIDKARTTFAWGPAPKPGQSSKAKQQKQKKTTTAKAASS
jgi:ribosome maturation factor RimP